MPYGITHCYLPPDKGKRAPPQPQPGGCSLLDLPTQKELQAELTLVLVMYQDDSAVRRQSPI